MSQNKNWTKPRYVWGMIVMVNKTQQEILALKSLEMIGRKRLEWTSLSRLGLACEKGGCRRRVGARPQVKGLRNQSGSMELPRSRKCQSVARSNI